MKYKQFLLEKEMEFYNNPKVVQKVPDNSDQVRGSEDYMYSNSDMQSFYSRGNGFITDDHSEFYEVIKAVKDFIDKHLFIKNMTWKVDKPYEKIIFTFNVTDINSEEEANFFLNGVQQHLAINIVRKMGDIYNIDSEISVDSEDNRILKLILTKNKKKRKIKNDNRIF